MGADPRLMALPAIRAEAERLAREIFDAYWAIQEAAPPKFSGAFRRDTVEAHACLLSDLTRPESRDALVRMLEDARCHDDWRAIRDNPETLLIAVLEVLHV